MRTEIIYFTIFAIIALALLSFMGLPGNDIDAQAEEFCGKENVADVLVCNGYIEVVSSLLGGGSTYYREDGTTITCPVVGPDSMSAECKEIFDSKIDSSLFCKSACTKVHDFESCVAAGYPVMESYPRQCRAGDATYVEDIPDVIKCKPEQRNADVCAEIYRPVCAKVNIQCLTTPCNPVYETFPNSCTACSNPLVESYTNGEC